MILGSVQKYFGGWVEPELVLLRFAFTFLSGLDRKSWEAAEWFGTRSSATVLVPLEYARDTKTEPDIVTIVITHHYQRC